MDIRRARAIVRSMDSDLIITGGGLNGTALAVAAAQVGLSSTIIDANPRATRAQNGFDGRSYALALTSVRMLRKLGLWDTVPNQPMNQIKVSDGRVGAVSVFLGLHFDSSEIEEGPMGHMVEDRHIRRALLDAMDGTDLIMHVSGQTVTGQTISAHGVQVTLNGGETRSGRLLIGADGRASGTATRAGIRRIGWDYRQSALVCAIAHEEDHGGVAHQLFLPPGPLAILPLTGNRSSIVWSEDAQEARAIQALDDDAYLDVLRPRFGDFLGDIRLAGQRYSYPLGMSIAQRFVGARLALVGDAAHGVHPIAGQGFNAGMRDVAALVDVLSHAQRRGEDIAAPDVLARYARWRRFDVAALATATDAFNRLFSNDNVLLRMGRDLGMAALNAVPNVRRGFIREAAGLTGDLPELMQG